MCTLSQQAFIFNSLKHIIFFFYWVLYGTYTFNSVCIFLNNLKILQWTFYVYFLFCLLLLTLREKSFGEKTTLGTKVFVGEKKNLCFVDVQRETPVWIQSHTKCCHRLAKTFAFYNTQCLCFFFLQQKNFKCVGGKVNLSWTFFLFKSLFQRRVVCVLLFLLFLSPTSRVLENFFCVRVLRRRKVREKKRESGEHATFLQNVPKKKIVIFFCYFV